MAMEIYEHKEDRGHRESCKYSNNFGNSCDCQEDLNGWQVEAMEMMGWEMDERSSFGASFYRSFDKHIITVAHCKNGWQLRWEKGPGFTYLETAGFGTIEALMSDFWGNQATRMDQFSKVSWEHGAMRNQLEQAGIEPRELGKKQKLTTGVPGPLKHEVTAIMDDPEDYGAGRGGG